MTQATIRIPTPLRAFTRGADEVVVEGATVGQALEALEALHEGILEKVVEPGGEVRRFVNIYLGDRNVVALAGLETPLAERAVISIVPAVAGGGQ